MIALVLAYLASLIPAAVIYFWFRNHMYRKDEEYKLSCRNAFLKGVQSSLLVMLFSFTLSMLGSFLFRDKTALLYIAYRKFIVLAFAEELAKFITFRRFLNTRSFASALDMICYMTLVGLGFEVIESVVYAFTTNAGQMLVRGITAMHAGYGFLMGYLYAKSRLTGNRIYAVLGVLIPFLLHGAYDFGLSEQFLALSDNSPFLSVSLALFALVLLIWMFLFTRKARKDPVYTANL